AEVIVAGTLGDVPFSYGRNSNTGSSETLLICSEELFQSLTGECGYAVLDLQVEPDITDAEVAQIRKEIEQACGTAISFSDKRMSNREVRGAGYSMAVFLYGFLIIIALLAFFNIINCIAMSVSARMREYGAMRAIGMSDSQLVRMIVGEALSYTVSGVFFGCIIGLPLNRMLFHQLVTSRRGEQWQMPLRELAVIVVVMGVAVWLAVQGPARRIRQMIVVDMVGTG
ncbi:MAG: ABC transporter permease, partial [Lachnospiraceae bacterium]|nr:ABC transporter permease [Lachnospiraceae bacterium]